VNITQEQEKEILELKEKIEEYATQISEVNPDNIDVVSDVEEMQEITKTKATEISASLIEKYEIPFCYSQYVTATAEEAFLKVLSSADIKQFIVALRNYESEMGWWTDNELDAFDDMERISDIDIDDANYIVKVYRIAPCWADGYLEAVVKCKTEEEAGKVADTVREKWGDFNIAGANVSTEIVKVNEETEREIKEEMRSDMTRLARNHHFIDSCEVLEASDVLELDEEL